MYQQLRVRLSSTMLLFSLVSIYLLPPAFSHAAHPLITDDTGTQGTNNIQIELNAEFSSDKETEDDVTTEETVTEAASILSYGFADSADIVLGVPYQWARTREEGDVISKVDGAGDMTLEIKWRFYEKNGFSAAVKPGITLPTGDEEKGLGSGKPSYSLLLITTEEKGPWAVHLNLGYMFSQYKLEEDKDANRKGIWHVSIASQRKIATDLTLAANIGAERNPDRESHTHPAFILGGMIYAVSENFDIDAGIKTGLNKPEPDLAVLAGTALRF